MPCVQGTTLHALIDSCHSGTVMNLPYNAVMRHGTFESWEAEYARADSHKRVRREWGAGSAEPAGSLLSRGCGPAARRLLAVHTPRASLLHCRALLAALRCSSARRATTNMLPRRRLGAVRTYHLAHRCLLATCPNCPLRDARCRAASLLLWTHAGRRGAATYAFVQAIKKHAQVWGSDILYSDLLESMADSLRASHYRGQEPQLSASMKFDFDRPEMKLEL